MNNSVNKNVRFKTLMLRSDLWEHSDAYITVKGTITNATNENDMAQNDNKQHINIQYRRS